MALNDDATLASDFMTALGLNQVSDYDMVATKVILTGTDEIDSAGVVVHSDGSSEERLRGAKAASPIPNETTEVFGPSGAAGLYSRTLLNATGGFDERFFAYYEDVDLAWRARRKGFRCLYNPRACVFHRHSASWGRISKGKLHLLERNRLWNLWKNYPLGYVLVEPVTRWLELARLARSGYLGADAKSKIDEFGTGVLARVFLSADLEALGGLRRVISERRSNRLRGSISDLELRTWIDFASSPVP